MAIPAPRQGLNEQRQPFARLRAAFETLNEQGLALDTLSMGMSRRSGGGGGRRRHYGADRQRHIWHPQLSGPVDGG